MDTPESGKTVVFLHEPADSSLKSPHMADLKPGFKAGTYEFRFAESLGGWLESCSIVHILHAANYEHLKTAVVSAWRNFLPLIVNAESLKNVLDDYRSNEKNDEIQDLLNKINCLIFTTKQEHEEFLKNGFHLGKVAICPHLFVPLNPGQTEFSIKEQARFSLNPDCLQMYDSVFDSVSTEYNAYAAKKVNQLVYLDISLLCEAPHYNGVPHFVMQCIFQLKKLYKERLRFVLYLHHIAQFRVCDGDDLLNIISRYQDRGKLPFPRQLREELIPNSKFVILGGAWATSSGYIQNLQNLCFDKHIDVYIYVADVLKDKFPFSIKCIGIKDIDLLCQMTEVVHQLLTNSQSSLKDIVAELVNKEVSLPPINILPRGVNIVNKPDILPRYLDIFKELPPGAPYILIVGTLIYRKNYLLIYNIYRRLLERFEPESIPHLICVGHVVPGNIVSELMQEDPVVNKHIHICSNATDKELDILYKNCLFTLYPSFYEGFGVPIAESLSYGKVCIASNTSSMPEVAPDHADLIDPLDFISWYERICDYIFNYRKLRAREQEIAGFEPHSYGQATRKLYEIMEYRAARSLEPPIVSLGSALKLGEEAKNTQRVGVAGSGCAMTLQGIALEGAMSELQFRVPGDRRLAIRLDCIIRSPKTGFLPVEVQINHKPYLIQNFYAGSKSLVIDLPKEKTEPGKFVTIHLSFINPGEPFEKWRRSDKEAGLTIEKISLENWKPSRREDLLAILDTLVEDGAALFRGLLRDRPDVAGQLPYSLETAALKVLMWAWQAGRYEHTTLSGATQRLFAALKTLHSVPGPNALEPGYTGLVHAIWLVRPDLEQSTETAQGQKIIVAWFNNCGCQEYGLSRDNSENLVTEVSGQTPATRARLQQIIKTANAISDHQITFTDLEYIKKQAGYNPLPQFTKADPQLLNPTSQLVTFSQFNEGVYYQRCAELGLDRMIHRKQWEQVFILQTLIKFGMLKKGVRGLEIDTKASPLTSVLASYGVSVNVAQFGNAPLSLAEIWRPEIVSKSEFDRLVTGGPLDFTAPMDGHVEQFDFVWSGGMVHRRSLAESISLLQKTGKLLRTGGIAVHVFDVNISDLVETLDIPQISFMRKKDVEALAHIPYLEIMPVNWSVGTLQEDTLVDIKSHPSRPHLKLLSNGYVITSLGLIIRKKEE